MSFSIASPIARMSGGIGTEEAAADGAACTAGGAADAGAAGAGAAAPREAAAASNAIVHMAAACRLGKVMRVSLLCYSHSMVAGGLELISYTTRFTPRTSLMMRLLIVASVSKGIRAQS